MLLNCYCFVPVGLQRMGFDFAFLRCGCHDLKVLCLVPVHPHLPRPVFPFRDFKFHAWWGRMWDINTRIFSEIQLMQQHNRSCKVLFICKGRFFITNGVTIYPVGCLCSGQETRPQYMPFVKRIFVFLLIFWEEKDLKTVIFKKYEWNIYCCIVLSWTCISNS